MDFWQCSIVDWEKTSLFPKRWQSQNKTVFVTLSTWQVLVLSVNLLQVYLPLHLSPKDTAESCWESILEDPSIWSDYLWLKDCKRWSDFHKGNQVSKAIFALYLQDYLSLSVMLREKILLPPNETKRNGSQTSQLLEFLSLGDHRSTRKNRNYSRSGYNFNIYEF